jgi:ABC-type lipoprotein release transport system permease subunit
VVAAGTFAASLDRLASEPARYGWVADFAWVDARDPQLAEIERDPGVKAVGFTTESQVELTRGNVSAVALEPRKGDIAYTLLEGRAPRTPREMSVGPRLADRLGVGVGDTVVVRPPSSKPVTITVTGINVVPAPDSSRFGESAAFTPDGLSELGNGQPFTAAFIRATGPDQARELFDRYSGDLELIRAAPPEDVQGLLDLNPLPAVLGWFLAAVAAAVLAHALVVTTRRRARELAVLRVIGFTPRQVAVSVVTMATMTAAIGVIVGVPLGLAVGRLVWAEAAMGAAVAGDMRVPLLLLAVLPIAAVLGAILVSLVPARRAARLRPAVVLHSE